MDFWSFWKTLGLPYLALVLVAYQFVGKALPFKTWVTCCLGLMAILAVAVGARVIY